MCGEDVPPKAVACPECGACHNSGWKDEAYTYDGLDLPDDEFDHEDFTRREFGRNAKPSGISTLWWVTGLVLLLILIAGLLRGGG